MLESKVDFHEKGNSRKKKKKKPVVWGAEEKVQILEAQKKVKYK